MSCKPIQNLQLIKMSLELTGLVEDFIATRLLSKIELDFLESELWETLEHIDEITSLTSAPSKVSKDMPEFYPWWEERTFK